MPTYLFTKEGYEELKKALVDVEKQLKAIMAEKGEAGRGSDGWHSEEFKALSVREMMLSKRVEELQKLASNARVVEPEEQDTCVQFGTGVVIEYEDGTERKIILGGYQISHFKNLVSIHSPLGRALVGAKVSEERTFRVGDIERRARVKKILLPSKAKTLLE